MIHLIIYKIPDIQEIKNSLGALHSHLRQIVAEIPTLNSQPEDVQISFSSDMLQDKHTGEQIICEISGIRNFSSAKEMNPTPENLTELGESVWCALKDFVQDNNCLAARCKGVEVVVRKDGLVPDTRVAYVNRTQPVEQN